MTSKCNIFYAIPQIYNKIIGPIIAKKNIFYQLNQQYTRATTIEPAVKSHHINL